MGVNWYSNMNRTKVTIKKLVALLFVWRAATVKRLVAYSAVAVLRRFQRS